MDSQPVGCGRRQDLCVRWKRPVGQVVGRQQRQADPDLQRSQVRRLQHILAPQWPDVVLGRPGWRNSRMDDFQRRVQADIRCQGLVDQQHPGRSLWRCSWPGSQSGQQVPRRVWTAQGDQPVGCGQRADCTVVRYEKSKESPIPGRQWHQGDRLATLVAQRRFAGCRVWWQWWWIPVVLAARQRQGIPPFQVARYGT